MRRFSIWERYRELCQNMSRQGSDFVLGSKYARILNIFIMLAYLEPKIYARVRVLARIWLNMSE